MVGGNDNEFFQPTNVTVGATNSLIGAGQQNKMGAVSNAFILAGRLNRVENTAVGVSINAEGEGILTGSSNLIQVSNADDNSSISHSVIVTGSTNKITMNAPGLLVTAPNNVIVGGRDNTIDLTTAGTRENNSILTGYNNKIQNVSNSSILSGFSNTLLSSNSAMIGIDNYNVTTQDHTTYMRRLRHTGGIQAKFVTTNSTPYNLSLDDYVLFMIPTFGPAVVNLPPLPVVSGQMYIIKRDSTNNSVTIDPGAGNNITFNGSISTSAAPLVLPNIHCTIALIHTGGNVWHVLWFDYSPAFGTTALRPANPWPFMQYWDTTLNIPIWWNVSNWEDATGTAV
jgi:hypothetical protein